MHFSKITMFAAAALSTSAARADDATDAKAFVAGLFATYQDDKKPPAGAHQIYDAQLQTLMDEDVRLAKGEVPALDFDPVCQCQDFAKLQATLTVRSSSASAAVVMARFRDIGITASPVRQAVFELSKEHGAWRIHDIHADDPKSLRAFLGQQNVERAHPEKRK
jgi:ABC-type transporter MlaC component